MRLFAIVLAAGEGRRFGATKQLADFDGRPMCAASLATAEQVCGANTLLVTGHEGATVLAAAAPRMGFAIRNERYREGLGRSIACAVDVVTDVADAVMILLADQPFVTADDLVQLIDAWQREPDRMAAADYANTVGPPAIFPRVHFARLRTLRGDVGAKQLIKESDCVYVPLANAAFDVDRRQDLERN